MKFDSNFQMTIDGVAAEGSERFEVRNPATGEVIASAPDCSKQELDAAVWAARQAYPAWSSRDIGERRDLLVAFSNVILANIAPLKMLLTSEQGKPHVDAEMEVAGAAMFLQGSASLELPVTVIEDGADRRVEVQHVSLGVVAALAPWNFPLILAMFKIGPALLAGNTMVLKPSPFTPLSTLKLVELARAILPPGVLNVVCGTDRLGPWMTEHPGVDKVSFTGSTETGRRVMASAAATLKRLTLELGGNDAAIVLQDVDIAEVAPQIFWAAFRNAGQICIASKRVYVHEAIYDEFAAALVAYAKTVKVGDGAQQGTQIGPINNKPQFDRVADLIADTHLRGYAFLLGGDAPNGPGFVVPVSIVDNPPDESRIVREEQFGPIVPLLKFSTIEEVIRRANDTDYGLAGSVWSRDAGKALEVGRRLQAGTVWINETQYLTPFIPFGGQKQSGAGVEGGVEGLLEYTNTQTLIVRKPAAG